MSIRLMARVWERCLSHAQQSILLALSDHAGDDGSHVYPSLAHIAWKTGYSARQVKRVIADLRRMGVLEVVAPARRGRPVEYRVHIEAVPEKSPLRKDDMKALQDRGDAVTWATVEVASAADTGDISGPIETLLKPEEPTLLPVTSTGTGDAPPVESKVLSPPPRGEHILAANNPDPRHGPTRALIEQLHHERFGINPQWDGCEGAALKHLLKANPNWTFGDLENMVRARFNSDEIPPDPPRMWLRTLGRYSAGPLDKFNRPRVPTRAPESSAEWAARLAAKPAEGAQ